MKVYLLIKYDYDDNIIINGYYLKEEAQAILDGIDKFTCCDNTKWASDTDDKSCCSIEAIDYECNKILPGYDNYHTYYIQEIEVS